MVDVRVITRLCGTDWGWYKTVTINIEKVLALAEDYLSPGAERETINDRLQQLGQEIEDAPKSIRWKVRARVGERVRWYELPDDLEGDAQEAGVHRGTGTAG